MTESPPHGSAHAPLLAALEAADAPHDPSRPSSFALDRAAYAEALHLAAPAHTRAATGRTLQRVVALTITATAMLVMAMMHRQPVQRGAVGDVTVQAWKVTGGGAEPLSPRDFIGTGEMLQISVSSDQPRVVNVWMRDPSGTVEEWFGASGTRVEAGERVPLNHHTIIDARTGTSQVAVQVCAPSEVPGPDPWSDVLPPESCRPFLFALKHRDSDGR